MSVFEPTIVRQDFDPPHGDIELIVPEELYFLQGHFPGRPILPGVTQVHWAISLSRNALSLKPDFLGIEALKFHRIIEPLTRLRLVVEHIESSGKLQFSYTSELGQHSQGRILFGEQ